MLRATGSRKNITELAFYNHISDIIENSEIQKLNDYTHHIYTTRFQHSLNVAYYNYLVCDFLGLNAVSAARAGLMHDFFHYDRKIAAQKNHNVRHPKIAAKKAKKHFDITPLENDIITKHMWPATLNLPKYKETYVIVVVDKYCAVLEVLAPKYRKIKEKIKLICKLK